MQWREGEDGRERSIGTFGTLSWKQFGYYDPNFFTNSEVVRLINSQIFIEYPTMCQGPRLVEQFCLPQHLVFKF